MIGYLPALVALGIGLLVLVVELVVLAGPVRRLSRAAGGLRAGLDTGLRPLRAGMNPTRPGAE